jgi:hypothetical protein
MHGATVKIITTRLGFVLLIVLKINLHDCISNLTARSDGRAREWRAALEPPLGNVWAKNICGTIFAYSIISCTKSVASVS